MNAGEALTVRGVGGGFLHLDKTATGIRVRVTPAAGEDCVVTIPHWVRGDVADFINPPNVADGLAYGPAIYGNEPGS